MSAQRRSTPRQDLALVPGSGPDVIIRPESGRRKLNGIDHIFRHWSHEQWERTPAVERPADAFPGDAGGYFHLKPEQPYESLDAIKRRLRS